MNFFRQICLLIIAAYLLISSSILFAQCNRYLSIADGLSNNIVTTIYQDHNGFMWFGTYDGLNRYDGYSFKIFRNIIGDSTSLPSNLIYNIAEDDNNNLWIGGQKGLSKFNSYKSSFSQLKFKSVSNSVQLLTGEINSIKSVKNSNIYVGTKHEGFIVYSKGSLTGEQVLVEGFENKKGSYNVTAVEFDTFKNVLYVFVNEIGLCCYDTEKRRLRVLSTSVSAANSIRIDQKGNFWIATKKGLYRFYPADKSISSIDISTENKIVALSADLANTLWIATDGDGVWTLPDGAQKAVPYSKEAIKSNSIYSIFSDKDNRKWIGTLRGGITVVDTRKSSFEHVVSNSVNHNNKAENFILSLCEDEKQNLWIGTDGSGIKYWNRKENKVISFQHNESDKNSVSSNFITGVTKDHANNIWISTWFGGINKLNKTNGTFKRYSCVNNRTKQAENNIWFVFSDSKERLWASATNEGSLYLYNPVTDNFDLFDERIMNLQSMTEDSEHNLWAGNYSSLIKIDPVTQKHTFLNIGYPVRCIHEDKNKNFWIGTQEGGLLLVDRNTNKYRRFTTNNGLPGNTILKILEDNRGNLWMSTYNGLTKFNRNTKSFKNFSQSDGLQSNQFSFNAALHLTTGQLAFGGINGFNIFYPDSIYEKAQMPKLFLTGLRINNQEAERNSSYVSKHSSDQITSITVPYNDAAISLDFVALDFFSADKIKYAYYLEGWDKGWNYVNSNRTANYTRLQEGKYTFKVKCTNTDGKWSNETQLLSIVILPPWYRSWWAYLLYITTAAGLIYIYLKYKNSKNRLQYELRLAYVDNEKEKELNEKKISFFTNIAHEFRAPLSLIINPIKDILNNKRDDESNSYELNIVYKNARRLLRMVDQLLLFKKADSKLDEPDIKPIELFPLCKDVYSCFIQQARAKKINYQFEFLDKSIQVLGDQEKLEIALFNLLSNAFKYTAENGNILFKVLEQKNVIEIKVFDSGIGIPAETGERLFEKFYQVKDTNKIARGFGIGLYLVKNFVEAHNGTVNYQSEVGKGSTFIITLKKHTPSTSETIFEQRQERSTLFEELTESEAELDPKVTVDEQSQKLVTEQQTILVIDDDNEVRKYLAELFKSSYKVYEASDGELGLKLAQDHLPDIILSDLLMTSMGGIDLCRKLKQDSATSHIPVILLTGSTASETELQCLESGADDYIKKPFSKEILVARVATLLKSRTTLQRYFYNEVTLQDNNCKVSVEYKDFIEKCIAVVESHLHDPNFSIKVLATALGMSHSALYKKVKSVSGQTVTAFIRFIKLRKAAQILISTECNINEAASEAGFNDIKHFREQFTKLFEMKPSEYVRKYRKGFHNTINFEKIRK